jgi:hypothetical protein
MPRTVLTIPYMSNAVWISFWISWSFMFNARLRMISKRFGRANLRLDRLFFSVKSGRSGRLMFKPPIWRKVGRSSAKVLMGYFWQKPMDSSWWCVNSFSIILRAKLMCDSFSVASFWSSCSSWRTSKSMTSFLIMSLLGSRSMMIFVVSWMMNWLFSSTLA